MTFIPVNAEVARSSLVFLMHGGVLGEMMRAHDWAATPLGAPESWPQPLKTLVGVMLCSNQPMFIAWGQERILLYNDDYAEILAGKHPAALGRPFLDVWFEIRADLLPIVEQAYAGQPVHMDDIALTMLRRGYPEETHFAFSYTPIRDESGEVAGLFCPCTEITAQVLAEARLRELNETLERRVEEAVAERNRMWEISPDLMLIIDFDGVFQRVNPAWTAVLGYTAGELVGHHVNEFVLQGDHQNTIEAYELAAGGGQPRIENGYRHRDGSVRWISWVAAPAGGMTYANGRDVTAEKKQTAALAETREQLRQSQKMEAVGQLTGGIAHDFNNMLQVIGGGLEMMRRRLEQGRAEEAGNFVQSARETVERAAALTQRLLAFARRQTLQPKAVEPDTLIEGMAELIQRSVGPAITLELSLRDVVWTVLCDPSQLENALLNLAINARDAMTEDGTLTIATADVRLTEADVADVAGQEGAAPGEYVEISVADTGAGMDEVTRARAFEPFFTTKPIGQGTGLGLSQTYGFVRQSGGVVHLDSVPGRGTTVRMYLPRHEMAGLCAEPQVTGEQPRRAGTGEVVLLVEDERKVRVMAAERLRESNYYVLEAEDGAAALTLLRSGVHIDLLVTDVGLPGGLNGRQVADAVREHRPGLPVLFITGYAGAALERQLAPGMAVIGKPFTLDALAAEIGNMLSKMPTGGAA